MADDKKSKSEPKDAKAEKSDVKSEKAVAKPAEAAAPTTKAAEAETAPATLPAEAAAEPWPDATPQPMRPVDPPPARARAETMAMPAEQRVGAPPEVPAGPPSAPVATGAVEDPTSMPGPRQIPGGNPGDAAAPPGRVPPGDSRSLRRGGEFALIYRVGTAVITRFGTVGQRGQWRVVDYPTSSSASNAYAKEASRFVSEGFSDYRD